MHPRAVVDRALAMRSAGLAARDTARLLGLPLGTVQHWYRGDRRVGTPGPPCPRCDDHPLDEERYVHLLGWYLGDGHIVVGRRGVASLSLFCADDWPGLRTEAQESLQAVMPSSSVSSVARAGCRQVKSYSTHWPCLFPQHGAGRKHTRPIVLEPWQQELVARHPGRLLRGLFHSDGCRILNWTQKRTADGVRRFEYPRYFFSNKSDDILGICAATLDLLDIPHRRPRPDMLSVARRAAVAALDEHVGPKY